MKDMQKNNKSSVVPLFVLFLVTYITLATTAIVMEVGSDELLLYLTLPILFLLLALSAYVFLESKKLKPLIKE